LWRLDPGKAALADLGRILAAHARSMQEPMPSVKPKPAPDVP
jgi:hypothetical protein